MRSLTQFLGHISGVPRREAILRVPMMMRGRGVRMARVSAAIFLWTLAISCVSLVHGATDPSDGMVPCPALFLRMLQRYEKCRETVILDEFLRVFEFQLVH